MDSEKIDVITELPTELQCYILSQDIDITTVLEIRKLSNYYYDLTTNCVKSLVPSVNEKPFALRANLILQFPNLISVSPEYPIKINHLDELVALSKHPRLRFATFDITNINVIATTGKPPPERKEMIKDRIVGNTVQSQDYSTRIFTEYGSFWPLNYFFHEREIICQKCPNNPSFSYTFFVKRSTGKKSTLRVYEGGLENLNSGFGKYSAKLIEILRNRHEICQYIGEMNKEVAKNLLELPCLREVIVPWPTSTLHILDLFFEDILSLLQANIPVSFLGELGLDEARKYYDNLKDFLDNYEEINNEITSFIPIFVDQINTIKKDFPNLTEISLLIEEDNIPWSELEGYQRIYLHPLLDIPLNIPENLLDRVSFT